MNELETFLGGLTDKLEQLAGAPAVLLVMLLCLVAGYALKFVKRFPNDGIPLAVILLGGVIYPLIADANNELTLRVWLVRNLIIGLIVGFVAWLLHNKVLSKIEDKLGIGPKMNGTVVTAADTTTK